MVSLDGHKAKRGAASPTCVILAVCVVCVSLGYLVGHYACAGVIDSGLMGVSMLHTAQSPVSGVLAGGYKEICVNTCKKANDGICDDGRGVLQVESFHVQEQHARVYCDLGTDCADCGPWTPSAPVPWAEEGANREKGPIELLMAKGVEVRLKRAALPFPLFFAYTDPEHDVDVSKTFVQMGVVEAGISRVFYKILENRCNSSSNGKRALVVDVGANFGWYSVFAAAMGCRVLACEPVPHFYAFLQYTAHLNGFSQRIDMRRHVISHEGAGKEMEMVVPNRGIWGTAGIGGLNIDQNIKSQNEKMSIPSFTLDELVNEAVLLLKVDVEGWEWSVFKGASRLLAEDAFENIVMEYSPGVLDRNFLRDDMIKTVSMLDDISKAGYKIGHLGDHRSSHMGSGPWESFTRKLEEVTPLNLKYDMHDANLWKLEKLGCPPVPELAAVDKFFQNCNGLPEDFNPRSFRATIDHNTNIWATKNTSIMILEGTVGILKPDAPASQWFVTDTAETALGMGSRYCFALTPDVQVKHRCPCKKPSVCGKVSELVQKIASEGKMPSNYVLK